MIPVLSNDLLQRIQSKFFQSPWYWFDPFFQHILRPSFFFRPITSLFSFEYDISVYARIYHYFLYDSMSFCMSTFFVYSPLIAQSVNAMLGVAIE